MISQGMDEGQKSEIAGIESTKSALDETEAMQGCHLSEFCGGPGISEKDQETKHEKEEEEFVLCQELVAKESDLTLDSGTVSLAYEEAVKDSAEASGQSEMCKAVEDIVLSEKHLGDISEDANDPAKKDSTIKGAARNEDDMGQVTKEVDTVNCDKTKAGMPSEKEASELDIKEKRMADSDAEEVTKKTVSHNLIGTEVAEMEEKVGLEDLSNVTTNDEISCNLATEEKSAGLDLLKAPGKSLSSSGSFKAHRLTPDFPDALIDLLVQFQSRRLNDQRCSFRRERDEMRKRRCYSEPSTPQGLHKVFFSSMSSLQAEEFFEMLASTQGRRLDDQRAELKEPPPPPPAQPSEFHPIRRMSQFISRASARMKEDSPLIPVKENLPPKKDADEELYSMILSYQVQGRIDDQRSVPPGPVDDEDFFSLLLRVQGGRMEEQRVEMPASLLRRVNST
ncbi:GPSM2 protein, partial [Polypterus senegalus]|nr:uncharacterized protein LOC120539137 [Polypterus senegalus]MBN3290607.1 GPSM2 protein [Polypterus senegalus]